MADVMPPRMTQPERALAHAVSFCAASRMHDDRLPLMIEDMRRLLQQTAPRDAMLPLRQAAQGLIDAYPRRNQPAGANDWCLANLKADIAAQGFHWQAFAALVQG